MNFLFLFYSLELDDTDIFSPHTPDKLSKNGENLVKQGFISLISALI